MKVNSTAINQVKFDRDANELKVQFNSGKWYSYLNVPRKVAEDFQQSDSKGQFFHDNIKNKFKGIKH